MVDAWLPKNYNSCWNALSIWIRVGKRLLLTHLLNVECGYQPMDWMATTQLCSKILWSSRPVPPCPVTMSMFPMRVENSNGIQASLQFPPQVEGGNNHRKRQRKRGRVWRRQLRNSPRFRDREAAWGEAVQEWDSKHSKHTPFPKNLNLQNKNLKIKSIWISRWEPKSIKSKVLSSGPYVTILFTCPWS